MTKIKICGLTKCEEISYINKYQPDYVGFVFAKSRRRVTTEMVSKMSEMLKPGIKKVGVFVNEDINVVNEISHICGIDVVQLHGDEAPEYCMKVDRTVWKAFRIKDYNSIDKISQYNVDAILLDTYSKDDYGGTGRAFDWNLISGLNERYKIVLAGGLNLENVEDAVKTVHPYCVDVSSGVEINGVKDENKIREFANRVLSFKREF